MTDPTDPYFSELYPHFLDIYAAIDITEGRFLPHHNQGGKIQFITFRLADSLPQSEIKRLITIKEQFYHQYPQPWDADTRRLYATKIGAHQDRLLDKGYGECYLRDADTRKIIVDAIHFFDGARYDVIAYIIMPNHIHALLLIYENQETNKCIRSIKSFSARSINAHINGTGQIWNRDYWDRLIRNRAHLDHCLNYIKRNPQHLPTTDYTLYLNPDWT